MALLYTALLRRMPRRVEAVYLETPPPLVYRNVASIMLGTLV